MKMETLSETISHSGTLLPGVKDFALDYLLLDEDYDLGNISSGTYDKRIKGLLEKAESMYGDGTLLFDWMEQQGLLYTDNTFFSKAVNVSRLKDMGELTIDNGVIFFVAPENNKFNSDVEKLQNMGLSFLQAYSARKRQDTHAIVVNENHRLLGLNNGATFNLYRPRTLREVSKLWDKIRARINR